MQVLINPRDPRTLGYRGFYSLADPSDAMHWVMDPNTLEGMPLLGATQDCPPGVVISRIEGGYRPDCIELQESFQLGSPYQVQTGYECSDEWLEVPVAVTEGVNYCAPFQQAAGPLAPLRTTDDWRLRLDNTKTGLCQGVGETMPSTDPSTDQLAVWPLMNAAPPFLAQNWTPPPDTSPDGPDGTYPTQAPAQRAPCPVGLGGTDCSNPLFSNVTQCSGYGWLDGDMSNADVLLERYEGAQIIPNQMSAIVTNSQKGKCLAAPLQLDAQSTIFPNAFVSWASPLLVNSLSRVDLGVVPSMMTGTWSASLYVKPVAPQNALSPIPPPITPTTVDMVDVCNSAGVGPSPWYIEPTWGTVVDTTKWPDPVQLLVAAQSAAATTALNQFNAKGPSCGGGLHCGVGMPLLGIAASIVFAPSSAEYIQMAIVPGLPVYWTWRFGIGAHALTATQSLARPCVATLLDDLALPLMAAWDPTYGSSPSWRLKALATPDWGGSPSPIVGLMNQIMPPVWVSRRALTNSSVTVLATIRTFASDSFNTWAKTIYDTETADSEPVLRYGVTDAGQMTVQLPRIATTPGSGVYQPQHQWAYVPVRPAPVANLGSGPIRVVCPNEQMLWTDKQEQEEQPRLLLWTTVADDPRFTTDPAFLANDTKMTADWFGTTQLLSRVPIASPTIPRVPNTDTVDPWAAAADASLPQLTTTNSMVDSAETETSLRFVCSPHFRYLMADPTYQSAAGVLTGCTTIRVHDDLLTAPDQMLKWGVRTATFLLDGGQLIVCALGIGPNTDAAKSDVVAQMTALKNKLNQDSAAATLGTRWPIPLEEQNRQCCCVPTLPAPSADPASQGGLQQAETVLLGTLNALYARMSGDWLANKSSVFYLAPTAAPRVFALRIVWLNCAVDQGGMDLDVFNPMPPCTVNCVQSATCILAEMFTPLWDAPASVPSYAADNSSLIFLSPLGRKLLRYARQEAQYVVGRAVYSDSLNSTTHDQVWLVQNVYNADDAGICSIQKPSLWDDTGGGGNAVLLCEATVGNAAPVYTAIETTAGFKGKPCVPRFDTGVCACLAFVGDGVQAEPIVLRAADDASQWFSRQPGVTSHDESIVQQIVNATGQTGVNSHASCFATACSGWLTQFRPGGTVDSWFEGDPTSRIKFGGGAYSAMKNTCTNLPTTISICSQTVVIDGATEDETTEALDNVVNNIKIDQTCGGGGGGDTWGCVASGGQNTCVSNKGGSSLTDCQQSCSHASDASWGCQAGDCIYGTGSLTRGACLATCSPKSHEPLIIGIVAGVVVLIVIVVVIVLVIKGKSKAKSQAPLKSLSQ